MRRINSLKQCDATSPDPDTDSNIMGWLLTGVLMVVIGLSGYLLLALLKPEWFA